MTERLHQSYAATLLYGCPMELRHQLDHPREGTTDAMERGTVIHEMVLGGDTHLERMPSEFNDFRTKKARELRDEARSKGLVPILNHEYERLWKVSQHIRHTIIGAGYDLDAAENERTLEWTSELGVPCEGTPDSRLGKVVLDLKVSDKRYRPKELQKTIWTFAYDVQAAAYQEACGTTSHIIAFASLAAPARVHLVPMSESFLEVGRQRWGVVQSIWKRCQSTGEWPDFDVEPARPEPWMLSAVEQRVTEEEEYDEAV